METRFPPGGFTEMSRVLLVFTHDAGAFVRNRLASDTFGLTLSLRAIAGGGMSASTSRAVR
jgi:hypothetical protein